MLNKIKRLFNKPPISYGPRILDASQHTLSPNSISRGARKTIAILEDAGYQAYAVGGCVRDLLLGESPKDFDVATNATPEQVKQLFRRSRIVGRRFKIVHVRMGPEIIEVTTFRAPHSANASKHQSRQSAQGLLLRDNAFGSIEEDAMRRDFSMNALYYHPSDNLIYDYAQGVEAVNKRQVKMIGDPNERYREDPVRMLRAVRFQAKLKFAIEPQTAEPIADLAHLLNDISAARLFDEVLKLLLNGYALTTFNSLLDYGLFDKLFPAVAQQLAKDDQIDRAFIEQALVNTDKRIRSNKGVTPAFLFAALLWPVVYRRSDKRRQQGDSATYALQKAAGEVIAEQCRVISIPRRFTLGMREIWEMQQRLPKRAGKQAERLVEMSRFRAGYDFLLLREESGEIAFGLGEWWTRYQAANEAERKTMVNSLNHGKGRRPRRRKKINPQQS